MKFQNMVTSFNSYRFQFRNGEELRHAERSRAVRVQLLEALFQSGKFGLGEPGLGQQRIVVAHFSLRNFSEVKNKMI